MRFDNRLVARQNRMRAQHHAVFVADRLDRLHGDGKYTRKRTSSITEIPPGMQNSLERERIELSSDESVSVSDISNSDISLPRGDIPSRGISSQGIRDTSSHVISEDDIDGW